MKCVQMSLVYRKSAKSTARKYERSPGMEPNTGGVSHMTVINPGSPRSNPFQWIKGRGRNHRHLSPAYRTMKGARGWAEKHAGEPNARLVAVDEYGTIVTRPLSRKQVLRNPGRNSMAYNLSALRAAMRRNAKRTSGRLITPIGGGSSPMTPAAYMSKAAKKRMSKAWAKASGAKRKSKRSSGTKVRGGRVTAKAASKKRATAKGAKASAKSASKQAKVASKAATRAKKTTSKKVASKAAKVASKAATKASKAATKASSKAKKAKPSSKKAANAAAAKARRDANKAKRAAEAAASAAKKASRRAMSRGRISGKKGGLKLKGSPYRTGRLFNPPYIHVTGFERVKKGSRRTSRRISKKKLAANLLARTGHARGMPSGRRVQVVEFGPRSRRKGYAVYIPGHVSERAYVRKFKFGGAAKRAHSKAMRFGYSKKRYSRKPVTANRRHSMRRNSKRHSRRRHSVKRNSKRHSRRHSRRLRGNRYVVRNGRRRLRRNMTIFGVDPLTQIVVPAGYAASGLLAANAASNFVAGMLPQVTSVLDAGRPDALVTKSLVGGALMGAAWFFGGREWVPSMVRKNLGTIVAGMGCAVGVRLLRGTAAAPYLGQWGAGFGEYVDQPLGAYVQDPSLGEYVDQPLGEYVDQPLGGLGTMYAAAGYPEGVDPADQSGIDGLMDAAEANAGVGPFEAAAGMGTMYAAAGMGTMYAAAGLGDGTTGVVGSPIPVATFTPPVGPGGNQQPPFVSIQDPIDMARKVTTTMRRDLQVPTSMVTPEGRGSAGGIFSRSIFGGMMS